MEQLENRMVINETSHMSKNEYEDYLEYLLEEDDRRYEDEIFERMSE